jgi:hypothetical protein
VKWIAALFVCAVAASATDAPDTFEAWRYIHPRASFIAGFDWRKTAGSEFARALKQQFSEGTATMKSTTDFVESFESVLISGPTPKPGPMRTREGLLVMRGRFNLAKLRKSAAQQGGRSQRYDGIELLTSERVSIAVLDEFTLLAGDRASVTETLRARNRVDLETTLMARAREVGGTANAWIVASGIEGVTGLTAAVNIKRNADIDIKVQSNEPNKLLPLMTMAAAMQLKVVPEGNSVRMTGSFTPEQIRSTVRTMGEQMLAKLTGGAPTAAHAAPPPPVEEPPLPPEKQVVKIYGLDDGVREVPLNRR